MAKTRKDSRGYALKTGESQRKDGRYSYSWTERLGERKVIYAKTLQELRLKERNIIRINEFDRLVYRIENGTPVIKQCKGHYDD